VLKKIAAALAFFLVLHVALAVDYFGIDSTILEDAVDVKIVILAKEDEVEFKVFGNVANFSSNANCRVQEGIISCKRLNTTSININYRSSDLVELDGKTYKYYQQFILPYSTRASSIVTLPLGAVVANVTDAVYPKKYSMLSNGRNILVYWELENVSSLQPLAFQVYYQPLQVEGRKDYSTVYFLSAVILLVAIAVLFSVRRIKIKQVIKPEKVVLKVLDGYERKVFEAVKKAGSIKQGKIVELTGISKAKVSRVVKSLEAKGLLKTERRGRTKLVALKKKVF
jgi:uncharacterized membrane protein